MESINFARKQQQELEKIKTKDLRIARYTMIGLAILGVILAVVLGFRIFFTLKLQDLQDSIKNSENRVSQLQTLEKQYLVFARKVQLLFGLDQARSAKQEAVAFFYDLVPQDHTLLSVRVDAENESIVFQVQSPDVFALLRMLQQFRSRVENVENSPYTLEISNLGRDPTSIYKLNATLKYSTAAARR